MPICRLSVSIRRLPDWPLGSSVFISFNGLPVFLRVLFRRLDCLAVPNVRPGVSRRPGYVGTEQSVFGGPFEFLDNVSGYAFTSDRRWTPRFQD